MRIYRKDKVTRKKLGTQFAKLVFVNDAWRIVFVISAFQDDMHFEDLKGKNIDSYSIVKEVNNEQEEK